LGANGGKCVSGIKKRFLNWGQLGANVLVEYKNIFLIRGICYNWGQFFPNGGKFENFILIGRIFYIGGNGGKCVSGI